jgi:hypothetical protein
MARRRTAGSGDLRAYQLERLLYHQAGGWAGPHVGARIAEVRSGEPFVARGWELRLQPSDGDFLVDSDGRAVELTMTRWVDDDGVHHGEYRRPDGSLYKSWSRPAPEAVT